MGNMTFGETLARIRIAKGLSKAQLSNMTGISQSELVGIEKGRRKPQAKTFSRLVKALGCDPDELYSAYIN